MIKKIVQQGEDIFRLDVLHWIKDWVLEIFQLFEKKS